ncbi:MAG: hypothetical protein J6A60_01545 [Clostridia bacterium]|nr:hypothetical protein [Clostridia bacterium]
MLLSKSNIKSKDRGAETKINFSLQGKRGGAKGVFAEVSGACPEVRFAGLPQNMRRTVTVVESYRKKQTYAPIFSRS